MYRLSMRMEYDSHRTNLSSKISDRCWCDLGHPVDACITGPSGFGLPFNRARRGENMLVSLNDNQCNAAWNLTKDSPIPEGNYGKDHSMDHLDYSGLGRGK
jgi:hypothetical protein